MQAIWKRDPEAWQRLVAAQLEIQPRCVICQMRDLPGLTLTAHHLHYERDRRGLDPIPGEDLVTVHHETCHAFVEYLVRRHYIDRDRAHLRAQELAPQVCRELGIHTISKWYEEEEHDEWNEKHTEDGRFKYATHTSRASKSPAGY